MSLGPTGAGQGAAECEQLVRAGLAAGVNSYEVAEFSADPGATYTVKVRRWAGTGDMPYGIAWSTRSDSRLSTAALSELLQIANP